MQRARRPEVDGYPENRSALAIKSKFPMDQADNEIMRGQRRAKGALGLAYERH
jgi:hypothetical protein